MSNKAQVLGSLKFQLLKKQPRTATSKCHSKRSVFATARTVSANAIYRILPSVCSLRKKNICVNYFYSLGSVRIESSSIVSWTRRLTSLIVVNCRFY